MLFLCSSLFLYFIIFFKTFKKIYPGLVPFNFMTDHLRMEKASALFTEMITHIVFKENRGPDLFDLIGFDIPLSSLFVPYVSTSFANMKFVHNFIVDSSLFIPCALHLLVRYYYECSYRYTNFYFLVSIQFRMSLNSKHLRRSYKVVASQITS